MSAVGWLIAAGGLGLLYLALRPRVSVPSVPTLAEKLGGSPSAPVDLNPAAPVIVGIPKTILPTGYADCIVNGGKWNYNGGSCVYAG